MQFCRGDGDEIITIECCRVIDSGGGKLRIGMQMIGKTGEVVAKLVVDINDFCRAQRSIGMGAVTVEIAAIESGTGAERRKVHGFNVLVVVE